jgi:DNA-binding transcriptional LysR family regulator
MDPDLASMRAFVAVAEELHFSRAALRLGLSQPQVSRQVRGLEESLGVELFARTPRRVDLTGAGRELLGEVREALAVTERLRAHAASLARGAGAQVNIGFLWSTLSGYVPPLVAGAAERHPEVRLGISQVTFLEVLPALRRGDLDVVFGRLSWAEHELVEFPLTREPSWLALPADHPLAAQEQVDVSQLDGLEMVAFQRELVPTAYDAILQRAREANIELRIVRHVRSASEALALVSAGVGVYRLASSAALPFDGVVYRELIGAPSTVTLTHRPLPPAPVQAVIDLARELFALEGRGAPALPSDAQAA